MENVSIFKIEILQTTNMKCDDQTDYPGFIPSLYIYIYIWQHSIDVSQRKKRIESEKCVEK